MAYDISKLAKLSALQALANRIADTTVSKTELSDIDGKASVAFKSGKLDGNTVSLYTTADATGEAGFSFDFPAELFLDYTKSTFVPSFTWSEDAYPGSTDPSLEGKNVYVLAVKSSDGTITYSFVDMSALVDVYTAKTEGKDASTSVTIDSNAIDVAVEVSAAEGNQLQSSTDGLYIAAATSVDTSGKADKATTLDGYGIADAYTKAEVDAKLTGAYKAGGSVAFADLPAADADHVGLVYNIKDAFTTTADFVEGADISYPANSNVVIVPNADATGYMYDVIQGGVDLSGYVKTADMLTVAASETEGAISVNGTDVQFVTVATDDEVEEVLDEVFEEATL